MRTVIFYSHKGGGGRSLTLANEAALLARVGYDVLAIDLDLEAPGLFEAFADLGPKEKPRDGFVEYSMQWLKRAKDGTAEAEPEPDDPGYLKILDMAVLPPAFGGRQGRLRLIRAGDYLHRNPEGRSLYWEAMREGHMESFYPLPVREGPSSAAVALAEGAAAKPTTYAELYKLFWSQVENRLSRERPDYLLIDTRTGISPLSATAIDAFVGELAESVDVFVFAVRGSEPSRLGTREFFRDLLWREHQEPAPRSLRRRFTIVCREQHLLGSVGRPHAEEPPPEEWLAGEEMDEPWAHMIDLYRTIRSDPEVERSGATLASTYGELPHRVLLDDYVSLLAVLLLPPPPTAGSGGDPRDYRARRSVLKAQADQAEAEAREALGIAAATRPTDYKLFLLPGGGGFRNVEDSEPNISFTLKTFRSLIAQLSSGAPAAKSGLDAAGRKAGEAFAKTLREKAPGLPADQLLQRWRKLDSEVGWGTFRLDPSTLPDLLEPGCKPRIRVYHNAFAPPAAGETREGAAGETPEGQNLCSFLGGYLGGILTGILKPSTGRKLTTDPEAHGEHCCVIDDKEDEGGPYCEFRFVAAPGDH